MSSCLRVLDLPKSRRTLCIESHSKCKSPEAGMGLYLGSRQRSRCGFKTLILHSENLKRRKIRESPGIQGLWVIVKILGFTLCEPGKELSTLQPLLPQGPWSPALTNSALMVADFRPVLGIVSTIGANLVLVIFRMVLPSGHKPGTWNLPLPSVWVNIFGALANR